ncbi:hypothetical protein BHM03_00034696 [Ensete ventricosum]|nr:hypothetical protein BHM03_00034696 [Ensete ventricosum]
MLTPRPDTRSNNILVLEGGANVTGAFVHPLLRLNRLIPSAAAIDEPTIRRGPEGVRRVEGEARRKLYGDSPFVPEIQDQPISQNFRLPALEVYDDFDLKEHTTAFRAQMALYGTLVADKYEDHKRPRTESSRDPPRDPREEE